MAKLGVLGPSRVIQRSFKVEVNVDPSRQGLVLDSSMYQALANAYEDNQKVICDTFYDDVRNCCDGGPARHHLVGATGWSPGKEGNIGILFITCYGRGKTFKLSWQLDDATFKTIMSDAIFVAPVTALSQTYCEHMVAARRAYFDKYVRSTEGLTPPKQEKGKKKKPTARKRKQEEQPKKETKRKREMKPATVQLAPNSSQTSIDTNPAIRRRTTFVPAGRLSLLDAYDLASKRVETEGHDGRKSSKSAGLGRGQDSAVASSSKVTKDEDVVIDLSSDVEDVDSGFGYSDNDDDWPF